MNPPPQARSRRRGRPAPRPARRGNSRPTPRPARRRTAASAPCPGGRSSNCSQLDLAIYPQSMQFTTFQPMSTWRPISPPPFWKRWLPECLHGPVRLRSSSRCSAWSCSRPSRSSTSCWRCASIWTKSPNCPPAPRSMTARAVEIAAPGGAGRKLVNREDIPDFLVKALQAREDARFFEHHGVDVRGLARATVRNLKDRDFTQGASTLSMQLARNSFEIREKSLHRKFLEIALTLRIESRYSKDEILTHYLNRIYFGAGADGIEQAARTYFGKATRELTDGECALIVGIIRGPHIFSPFRNLDAAIEQRNQTLNRMVAMGFIDEARRDAIAAEPVRLVDDEQARNPDLLRAPGRPPRTRPHPRRRRNPARRAASPHHPRRRLAAAPGNRTQPRRRGSGTGKILGPPHPPGPHARHRARLRAIRRRHHRDPQRRHPRPDRRPRISATRASTAPAPAAISARPSSPSSPPPPPSAANSCCPANRCKPAARSAPRKSNASPNAAASPARFSRPRICSAARSPPPRMEMSVGLATLGNKGKRPKPYLIREIRDAAGEVIYTAKPRAHPGPQPGRRAGCHQRAAAAQTAPAASPAPPARSATPGRCASAPAAPPPSGSASNKPTAIAPEARLKSLLDEFVKRLGNE